MEKTDFLVRVVGLGGKAVDILEAYFRGEEVEPDKVKISASLVGQGVKIKHMEQTAEHNRVSAAIRITKLLENPDMRSKYIAATQPTVRAVMTSGKKAK